MLRHPVVIRLRKVNPFNHTNLFSSISYYLDIFHSYILRIKHNPEVNKCVVINGLDQMLPSQVVKTFIDPFR